MSQNNKSINYSIIIPFYNEELVINECYKRVKEIMEEIKISPTLNYHLI